MKKIFMTIIIAVTFVSCSTLSNVQIKETEQMLSELDDDYFLDVLVSSDEYQHYRELTETDNVNAIVMADAAVVLALTATLSTASAVSLASTAIT